MDLLDGGAERRLAAASGLDVERLLGWCAAFAGMIALELASQGDGPTRAERRS